MINRTSKIRILRDNKVIQDGSLDSLKRVKDEVEEGVTGPTRLQVQKALDKVKGL